MWRNIDLVLFLWIYRGLPSEFWGDQIEKEDAVSDWKQKFTLFAIDNTIESNDIQPMQIEDANIEVENVAQRPKTRAHAFFHNFANHLNNEPNNILAVPMDIRHPSIWKTM